MKKMISLLLCAALALGLAACGVPAASSSVADSAAASSAAPASDLGTASSAPQPTAQPESSAPPADTTDRSELRGMWVSYLEWSNLDFTSEATFKADFDELLNNCSGMGLNAVFAQVRPFADALYRSELFPWSASCTGSQGLDPGFDPLSVMVSQAHARGIQLHAWVNPYRIANNAETPGTLAADNLANTHPEWVKAVDEALYLDPANDAVMTYICDGVTEILEKYNVDGIQFDDYFYPTTDPAFDEAEYAAYTAAGGALALEDWRRDNVNRLIQMVYATVKGVSANLVFGVSPQGNNDNNYNGQYSDVALWMSAPGYVDYVLPQVYWGYHYTLSGGSDRFAFENVTAEWAALPRDPAVALYFGLGAYRIGEGDGGSNADSVDGWNTGHTLADMVSDLRALGADGYALYRYDFLFRNESYAQLAEQECSALLDMNLAE